METDQPHVFHCRDESISAVLSGEPHSFVQRRLMLPADIAGSWVLVHARPEPRMRYAYLGVGRIRLLSRNGDEGHYVLALDSYLEFDSEVPSRIDGDSIEPAYHGLNVFRDHARDAKIIRPIPWSGFVKALDKGLVPPAPGSGMREEQASYASPPLPPAEARRKSIEILTSRLVRNRSNRRRCLAAYSFCAFSGERQQGANGETICEAAHIWSVELGGPDHIRNLFLASPTFHAAFDRGMLAIDDDYRILRSGSVARHELQTPNNPTERLVLPADSRLWPDLNFVRRHRHQVFRP